MAKSMQRISLIMLIVQNTALGIVSKYSRLVDGPKYKPGTAILLVETLKFFLCYLVVLHAKGGHVGESLRTVRYEVFGDIPGLKKTVILAFLYAMQNIMALFAYDYVDVATYQIVYQLKIITTAMFMIVLLNRRFSVVQWCAMLTLMIGVAVCSYSRLPATMTPTAEEAAKAEDHGLDSTRIIGVSIVVGLAINSGLAAAYLERVLKSHKSNATMQTLDPLWVRNLQLAAVSMAVTAFDQLRNFASMWSDGFFYGFHSYVWGVIFLQAVGGLTVAAVVRYSDNIVKNFGASFSLVLSCIISNYMFDQAATWTFYSGVILVVVSVFIYGDKRFAVAVSSEPAKGHAVAPEGNSRDEHNIRIEPKAVGMVTHSPTARSHVTRTAATFSVLAM